MIWLWFIYTRIFGAEFYGTGKEERKIMVKMLKLGKKDVFYDLGAGFGTVLIDAAPKVRKAIGFEIDPLRFLICLTRIKSRKLKNVNIILGNIFKHHLEPRAKIFVFLSKEANEKLAIKLKQEMKESTIVSYKWPVKNLKIVEGNKKYRLYKHKI